MWNFKKVCEKHINKSYCCSIGLTSCIDQSRRARHFQISVLIFFFFVNINRAKTRVASFFVPGDLAAEWLTDCDTQLLKKEV